MKSCFKSLFVVLGLVLAFQASASEQDWFFTPYVGADVGAQGLDWDTGYGEGHFNKGYPVGNLYFGAFLHQYVGIEFGFEHMFSREQKQYYFDTNPGERVLGFIGHNAGGESSFLSNASINGFNLSLLLKYPLSDKTELFATLGANWARMHLETLMIQTGNAANRPVYWRSDRHALARLGVGVKHQITENLGGRLYYLWENTSRLDATVFPGADNSTAVIPAPSAPTHLYTTKPHNSNLIMLGLYYQSEWVS